MIDDGKAIRLTELISAALVVLAGAFLLLVGANVFPFGVKDCASITVVITFLLISVVITVTERNRIGAFFTGIFFAITVAEALVLCGLSYGQIYPLYIIAVPLGATLALIKTIYIKRTILIALSIFGAAALLMLSSAFGAAYEVIVPSLAVYFGLLGSIYAMIKLRRNKK